MVYTIIFIDDIIIKSNLNEGQKGIKLVPLPPFVMNKRE